jgi:two-component system response regulator GlrR
VTERKRGAKAGATVLIVDDDARFAELLAIRLEANGYRISIETQPSKALARLGVEAIDALILDLRLQDVSGLDILVKVRERAPDVAVIMLTAHGTIDTAVEAMRRGAYGFLTKPY